MQLKRRAGEFSCGLVVSMSRLKFGRMYFLIWKVLLCCLYSAVLIEAGKEKLVLLDEDNWSQMLTGEWMVEFYAPWCPACKALEPVWKEYSGWSDDLSISIGHVDVTANPGLSGRFMITALPTIFHVKDGVFRQYRGARDKESFISFVEERKWDSVEPVSSWKAPQSIQMSVLSYFFKLSMALKNVHSKLIEEYGVPYWGSYLLFALATVTVGGLLGLIIVCVIDLLFPAKQLCPEDLVKSETKFDKDKEPDKEVDEAVETPFKEDNQELRKRKKEVEQE